MLAQRMLPFIWLRLVVLIGFTIFVATKSMWLITLIAVALRGGPSSNWHIHTVIRHSDAIKTYSCMVKMGDFLPLKVNSSAFVAPRRFTRIARWRPYIKWTHVRH